MTFPIFIALFFNHLKWNSPWTIPILIFDADISKADSNSVPIAFCWIPCVRTDKIFGQGSTDLRPEGPESGESWCRSQTLGLKISLTFLKCFLLKISVYTRSNTSSNIIKVFKSTRIEFYNSINVPSSIPIIYFSQKHESETLGCVLVKSMIHF